MADRADTQKALLVGFQAPTARGHPHGLIPDFTAECLLNTWFDGVADPFGPAVPLCRGMTEVLRPSLYGSQHPLVVVPQEGDVAKTEEARYVVVGHCCESGDLVSPAPDEPETLFQRPMGKAEVNPHPPSWVAQGVYRGE